MNTTTVTLTEIEIAKTSPALNWKSDRKGSCAYPKDFNNKVPLKVRMNKTVKPDMIFRKEQVGMQAVYSNEYYAWVNSYGALSVILPGGEKLGLVPGEFQVIEFHEDHHQDWDYERFSKISHKDIHLERYVASLKIIKQSKQVITCTGMIGNVSGYLTVYNKTGVELENDKTYNFHINQKTTKTELWYELIEIIKDIK